MKRHIAMLWAEALESGMYPQGKGVLDNVYSGYCCLGVLCDLAAQHGQVVAENQDPRGAPRIIGKFLDDQPRVMEWAGAKSSEGYIDSYHSLAGFNDSGAPFTTIAKIIRKHWREL